MDNTKYYNWAVIGAGPAGIAAVGKLLDFGIESNQIIWIDPYFTVGDFGSKWLHVSSNTKVNLFINFLLDCKAFNYYANKNLFTITSMNPEHTCELKFMAEPLQWITNHFLQQVNWQKDFATELKLFNRHWQISLSNRQIQAKNVIIATGADAKSLNHPGIENITLEQALNIKALLPCISTTDTVAVFGSSHSAIMAIRNLLECQVKHIINFYRAPLRYAVHFDDWTLFDDSGLKGNTAEWARNYIDGQQPINLLRVLSTENNIQTYLPLCNKAVYAIGFLPRQKPILIDYLTQRYNEHSGIIAPGLFGIGIGFPEAKADRFGNLEHRVGLWKFMDYLNRILPVWLNYSC